MIFQDIVFNLKIKNTIKEMFVLGGKVVEGNGIESYIFTPHIRSNKS